ncbi:MAG: hypothetical protein HDP34_01970 [Clostridia bacterium]|nr:hypothetical protein [Clostridia bacterium]
MKKLTPEQEIIQHDILRYKSNKLASSLALLGLVFNCLYFMLLYAYTDSYFQTITIGFSVILTLVVLLITFLSSEGVKGYNKKFTYVLLVIAAFQILRIFGYPLYGLRHQLLTAGYFGFYPTAEQSWVEFVILTVYLCASAACLIASAVLGWIQATKHENFQKKIDNGEVDVMAAIKKIESDEEAAKAQVEAQPVNTAEEVQ